MKSCFTILYLALQFLIGIPEFSDNTMQNDLQNAMTDACQKRLKVKIQMDDTPPEVFILFCPYAILEDLLNGIEFLGLMEEHHGQPVHELRRPTLKGLKTVEITDATFTPLSRDKWIDRIDFQRTSLVAETPQ